MVDRKRCRSCRYSGASYGGVCDYLSITGRSRIAQETPEDAGRPCRFYESGRRAIRREKILVVPRSEPTVALKTTGPNYRYSQDRMLTLYRQGLSDREISVMMGCSKATARQFRRRNSLPANLKGKEK